MSVRTENGFRSGSAEVISVAEINGYAVIWIQTPHKRVEIVATPAGRRLTVKADLSPIARASEVAR